VRIIPNYAVPPLVAAMGWLVEGTAVAGIVVETAVATVGASWQALNSTANNIRLNNLIWIFIGIPLTNNFKG
jgi:hypothetical protein